MLRLSFAQRLHFVTLIKELYTSVLPNLLTTLKQNQASSDNCVFTKSALANSDNLNSPISSLPLGGNSIVQDTLVTPDEFYTKFTLLNIDPTNPPDASTFARSHESIAYSNTTCLQEYNRSAHQLIDLLTSLYTFTLRYNCPSFSPLTNTSHSSSTHEPHPVVTAGHVGPFNDALHYRNGPFSRILLAHDPSVTDSVIPCLVALKLVVPSSQVPPHNVEREYQIVSFLHAVDSNHHAAHVTRILSTFRHAANLALVMPFYGVDLSCIISCTGWFTQSVSCESLDQAPPPPMRCITYREALRIIHDILSALAYVHSHKIIHRDIKPANILVKFITGPNPFLQNKNVFYPDPLPILVAHAYLIDFGIAWCPPLSREYQFEKLYTNPEPQESKCLQVGSMHYRAPELLLANSAYDTSIDLWSFGCIATELFHAVAAPCFTSNSQPFQLFSPQDASQPISNDLELINSIFRRLGTPSKHELSLILSSPSATTSLSPQTLDFTEHPPQPWTDILPNADEQTREFVAAFLRYPPSERLPAQKVNNLKPTFRLSAPAYIGRLLTSFTRPSTTQFFQMIKRLHKTLSDATWSFKTYLIKQNITIPSTMTKCQFFNSIPKTLPDPTLTLPNNLSSDAQPAMTTSS